MRSSRWLVTAALAATQAACLMDINVPLEGPPETWDVARNTHPAGPALQQLIDGYVREGLPGVVLLVRTPQGLWNGAAGYTRLESAERMTPTHRHFAASVTKMYTAAAVLLLVEDGLIDLDAAIARYLPSEIHGRIGNGSVATVRQLLGHTSGIREFYGDWEYDLAVGNDPRGRFPPERLLGFVYDKPALFPAGTGYSYSAVNYLLLALIMDRVAGKSHADVLAGRILTPLGLTATYYKKQPGYPRPAGLVNSYKDFVDDGRLENVTDITTNFAAQTIGHTGLIATALDLASFVEGLMEGRVVSSASLAEMSKRTRVSYYGLGLEFYDTPQGPWVGHGGADFGMLSTVRYYPESDATLVVLINTGDGGWALRLFNRLCDDAAIVALGPG